MLYQKFQIGIFLSSSRPDFEHVATKRQNIQKHNFSVSILFISSKLGLGAVLEVYNL